MAITHQGFVSDSTMIIRWEAEKKNGKMEIRGQQYFSSKRGKVETKMEVISSELPEQANRLDCEKKVKEHVSDLRKAKP